MVKKCVSVRLHGFLQATVCAAAVAVMLLLGVLVTDAVEYDVGPCGDNLVWRLDDSGLLVIDGTGDMRDGYSFDYYKHMIREVVIREGVTSIGSRAFQNCSLLTSVTIPGSVQSIGDWAFLNTALVNVVIPEGTVRIGYGAFAEIPTLESVQLPDSLKHFGEVAFADCPNLKSIRIPEGVTEIGDAAFAGCTGLTRVVISEGVACIGAYAFSGCKALTDVEIPSSVKEIYGGAFMSCTALESITLPEKLARIESDMFLGCESLKSLVIPPNVTHIGSEAFEHCHSLESIVIPQSVTRVPISAFFECDNLKSIVFENTYGWVCHDYDGNEMVSWGVDVKDSATNANFFPADGEFDGFYGGGAWLELIPASFDAGLRMWVNHDKTPARGFVICTDGYLYYCEDGRKIPYAGLVEHEGSYYYINDYGRPFAGGEKYITRTNGLTLPDGTPIPQGRYFFDEDGRMQLVIKQGLVDGVYYEDNLPVPYAGLIYADGAYYYINDNARPFAGGEKYITRLNGLTLPDGTPIPEGKYTFDADGRMQLVIKQGLVDGVYYINNLPKNYAGLIWENGKYYYINDFARPVVSRRYYVTNTHGLLPVGWYEFDGNGVMILPPF